MQTFPCRRAALAFEEGVTSMLRTMKNSARLTTAGCSYVCHRLNRGGDRAANCALHIIAIGQLRTDPRTKAYVAKRVNEGHSKLEAIRCLKRYIASEVFYIIRKKDREINQTKIVA